LGEVQLRVAELGGASLEMLEDAAPESASLDVWRDTHALDLRALRVGVSQSAHRDKLVVEKPDYELAALLEVDAADRVEVVVPPTRAAMRSNVVKRIVVQRPDGIVVCVLEATDP